MYWSVLSKFICSFFGIKSNSVLGEAKLRKGSERKTVHVQTDFCYYTEKIFNPTQYKSASDESCNSNDGIVKIMENVKVSTSKKVFKAYINICFIE